MARPPLDEEKRKSAQLVLRVEQELVERMDRFLVDLTKSTPWTRPTRADAVRALLHEALANHEAGTVLTDEQRAALRSVADRSDLSPGSVLTAAITRSTQGKGSRP